MKIMPRGDYYVWHCDWCDSTNYTIWTRLELEGFSCSACQQKFPVTGVDTSQFINLMHGEERSFRGCSL